MIAQAVYYAATGIWSPVSLGSFERVTGPKGDGWLVKTVGVLVTVIGAVLGLAARREYPPREVAALAVGSASGLAAIDMTSVTRAAHIGVTPYVGVQ